MSRHETTRVVRTNGTPMTDAGHRRQRALVEASLLRGIKTERPPAKRPRGVGR